MTSHEDIEKEIEALVRDYGRMLEGYLRSPDLRLPDHLVGEVIGDALAAVYVKRQRGEILFSPKSYLFRVARNAAIDRLQKALRSVEVPDSESVEQTGGQFDMLEAVEMSEDLRRAIEQLPRQQRRVIELRHLRDFTVSETAEILGISPGTVGPTTTAALRRLKQIMTEREEDREEGTR